MKTKTFYTSKRGDLEKIINAWLATKKDITVHAIKYAVTPLNETDKNGDQVILESAIIVYES